MYKHILVAVDGSDTSNLAFQEALNLAQELGATLRLIHVIDQYFSAMGTIDYVTYIKAIKDHAQSILSKLKERAQDARVKTETKIIEINEHAPRISEKIIEESITCKADLIVIGTHGRHGFSRFILGSVAEGVIRMATIPVLLIRGTK